MRITKIVLVMLIILVAAGSATAQNRKPLSPDEQSKYVVSAKAGVINVLEGDMSIVGPRPHAVAHDTYFDHVIADYAFRQRMKPGITGFAQVNGCRGETPSVDAMRRRVEFDVWYIDNWSFHLDFAIMFRTFVEIIRGRNAY